MYYQDINNRLNERIVEMKERSTRKRLGGK